MFFLADDSSLAPRMRAKFNAWAGVRAMVLALALTLTLTTAQALPAKAQTGWFSKLLRGGDVADDAGRAGRKLRPGKAAGNLASAAAHIMTLAPAQRAHALAAEIMQEGHWRFINEKGETFTAGTPAELKQVYATLLSGYEGNGGAARGPALYLTERSIFLQAALLKDAPGLSEGGPRRPKLLVVSGGASYPLITRKRRKAHKNRAGGASSSRPDGPRVFAQVKPKLLVEMIDANSFHEAIWQLNRTFDRDALRLLALQPGEETVLPGSPERDGDSASIEPESVDPFKFVGSMSHVRRQTIVMSGRIDETFLHFQPASGSAGALRLSRLRAAAKAADINLVMLNTSDGTQPGSRNWLWLRANVTGLEDALNKPRVADFLATLGAANGPVVVSVEERPGQRILLETAVLPRNSSLLSTKGIGDMISNSMSSIVGDIPSYSIEASLRSEARQDELDARFLPGIPSLIQFAYIAALVLGLIAMPVSLPWWRRLWPFERKSDYASRFGFIAARLVRSSIFLFVFLPLAGPLALPVFLARSMRHWLGLPLRLWQRARARESGASSP